MKGETIELGGKKRTLRVDLNAVAEIGKRFDLTLGELNQEALRKLPLSALRTCVWLALRHEDPDLDEETVGSWIHTGNFVEVLEAFFALLGGTSEEAQARLKTKMDEINASVEQASEDGINPARELQATP